MEDEEEAEALLSHPSTVLGFRVISLRALHREWCLKLAREVSRGFGRLAVRWEAFVDDWRSVFFFFLILLAFSLIMMVYV